MISLQYYKRSDNQIIKIKVKLIYFRLSGLFPGYKKNGKKFTIIYFLAIISLKIYEKYIFSESLYISPSISIGTISEFASWIS